MEKLKAKKVIRVCTKCGNYKEDEGEWKEPTVKDVFRFWLSGREQWEEVSAECPNCEKKRKEDKL
jgi:FMN-dependent NADH-azoreductase